MRLLQPREQHTEAESRELVDRFLDANPAVSRHLTVTYHRQHRLKCRGWYRFGRIHLIHGQMTRPGTGYSWPGHISDRTLLGVTAHELGHHVHLSRPDVTEISRGLPGPAVTGYEPDDLERFAETFRIFVLNPTLLREGRPARYAFLVEYCGLVPIETRNWREVLAAAPARMVGRIPAWSARGATGRQTELEI